MVRTLPVRIVTCFCHVLPVRIVTCFCHVLPVRIVTCFCHVLPVRIVTSFCHVSIIKSRHVFLLHFRASYKIMSNSLHEALPGHHYQVTRTRTRTLIQTRIRTRTLIQTRIRTRTSTQTQTPTLSIFCQQFMFPFY